jgi:hypothetical protein
MSRLIAFLGAVVTVACPAAGAPIPEGVRGPVFYHATRVGDRMTYQLPQSEVVYVVTAVEAKGGTRVVTIGEAAGAGKVELERKVEVSPRGVYILGVGLQGVQVGTERWADYSPPRCLLKLPAAPGEKWRWEDAPGLAQPMLVTGRPEVVKVPAGEFEAVTVDFTLTPFGGDPVRVRSWYALGVGEVKWASADGKVVCVLKSFTAGKD